ncbi:MAG: oligosaccharide flippase family protein, partial [Anaerolineae bacterium]|nr:oligosaccharide flippase family protein [Anaerolineae bacterium]
VWAPARPHAGKENGRSGRWRGMELIPEAGDARGFEAQPLAFRVVRGGLWVALSSYFNIGFGFLANLALTRILAPEHFGVFALASFFHSLVNLRPKSGIGHAFAQRSETSGELLGTHLILDVAIGLATVALAAAAIPVLRALGYPSSVAWVTLALAGVGVSESVMATAWLAHDKQLHFGRTSLISSVAFPLSYLPGLWLAFHGGGYWSLVAQNATYSLLLLAGTWWSAGRQLREVWRQTWRFDRQVAASLLRFGRMVGLASIAGILVTQFDNLLVGTFVGVATLGFYDRAYRIAQWPTLLVYSLATRAAFHTYARLQDDPARLQRTVSMSLWLVTVAALPLALAIFVTAPDLVRLLYGERWLPSALFVRFLAVYSLLRPLQEAANSLFTAAGQPRKTAVVGWSQALVLVVLATPLTLARGAVGTCVGVGISFLVGLALAHRYISEIVSLSLLRTLMLPALAALVSLAGSAVFARITQLGALPLPAQVALRAALAAAGFFVVMLAVQRTRSASALAQIWRLLTSGW